MDIRSHVRLSPGKEPILEYSRLLGPRWGGGGGGWSEHKVAQNVLKNILV